MEVAIISWQWDSHSPKKLGLSIAIGVQAPQMRLPGAMTLGLRTSATSKLKSMTSGPLDENRATCCAWPLYLAICPFPILAFAPNWEALPFVPLIVCVL